MIVGVGEGTFAVMFVSIAAIVLALFFAYLFPRWSLLTFLLCASLPFIVFGIIESAPRKKTTESATASIVNASVYGDEPMNTDDVQDSYFPVRVTVLTLLCLGVLGAGIVYLYDVLNAPAFTAPTVQCRRKQLESLHPTWYK